MNRKKLMAILAAGVFTLTYVNPSYVMAEATATEEGSTDNVGAAADASKDEGETVDADTEGVVIPTDGDSGAMVFSEDGTPVKKTVKARDISMQSQDSYEYPYMGLKAVLPDELKKQMDDSDVVMITSEDWTEDMSGIKYAFLHWDKLTEEQKNEDVNMLGTGFEDWLASIERIGTLGVYSTDVVDDLDSITGCTEHKELGTSADGKFKYYLSINKDAESELTDEIEKIKTTITDMTPFKPNQSAFDEPSENSDSDATTVGSFETTDIEGNAYTEKVFSDYDLTLVNAFPSISVVSKLQTVVASESEFSDGSSNAD